MPYKYEEAKVQQRIKAKISKVIDGDTMEITSKDDKTFIVRLWNIDCPEIDQDFGVEAKKFIEDRVLNLDIDFELISVGKHNRNVGKIFVTKNNNKKIDISTVLLASGFAHSTTQNINDPYFRFEARAKGDKIGLWSNSNYISPQEFRDKVTLKEKPVDQMEDYAARNLAVYPDELKTAPKKKRSKKKSLFD